MFVMKKSATAWWPVKVKMPDAKVAGRFITHEFEAEFKLIDADDAQARQDERADLLNSDEPAESLMRKINAFDFATWPTMIVNWRGVQNEDGDDIPFTDDILIEAVKKPLIRAAIERAWNEIISGECRRKN